MELIFYLLYLVWAVCVGLGVFACIRLHKNWKSGKIQKEIAIALIVFIVLVLFFGCSFLEIASANNPAMQINFD